MKINRGYTLIEILVAVGIFFIVIAAPTGFFVGSIKGQQKALSSQELLDQTSYVLEYMSRAIRMAKKDDITELDCCWEEDKVNYKITHGDQGIKFRNYDGDKCQEFYFENGAIKEDKTGYSGPIALTSDSLEVISFKVGPSDSWDQGDNDQPRITLFLEIKGTRSARPELQPVIKIQTTISQRNLDVIY